MAVVRSTGSPLPKAAATSTGGRTGSTRKTSPRTRTIYGDGTDYRAEFSLDLGPSRKDISRVHSHLAGLVAGRLRPLRAADSSHMAWHSPAPTGSGRPRRQRPRPALRTAQQLADSSAWTRPAACSGRSKPEVRQQAVSLGRPVLTGNVALESMGFRTFGSPATASDRPRGEPDGQR